MPDKSDSTGMAMMAGLVGTCLTVHLIAAVGVAGVLGAITANAWLIAIVIAAVALCAAGVWHARRRGAPQGRVPAPDED